MKRVILSRDKDDESIKIWLTSMGLEVLPASARMDSWVDGLVIGGGSDPGIPEDKERDVLEAGLIDAAIKERIPVLGICRGAEVVTVWAGGSLSPIPTNALPLHQNSWHRVTLSDLWNVRHMNVWSHHHLAIKNTGSLRPAAHADDGSIEAIADVNRRILGVLWHPERSDENGPISILPWLKWIEKRF